MSRSISAVLAFVGFVLAVLAFTQLVGLGVLREGPGWAIALGAGFVVMLPILGISGLAKHRFEAFATGALLWPIALLVALPVWFPGERPDALSTGFAHLAAPLGEEQAASSFGAALAGFMGDESLAGRPPAVEAEPFVPEDAQLSELQVPQAAELPSGQIALPYEGAGRSLRIPVVIESDGVEQEVWMLYDTGATYTTLTERDLDAIGISIPDDAPTITVHTAGGERTAQIVLIDRVWLGGFPVDGVTVAVCEECGSDEDAGLLGLNVSGQFTVTVDPAERQLVLEPLGSRDRHLDIAHWVEVGATATAWSDGRVEVVVSADSTTDRDVTDLGVSIHCSDEEFTATLDRVPAMGSEETRVKLPRGTDCTTYRIRLEEAHW